jgi:hypothetical protein
VGLFLEPVEPVGAARSVLPGQTAVWRAPFVHPDYPARIGTVEYEQSWPKPAHAEAVVITHVGPADLAGWSEVSGTVTNTGTEGTIFAIEVQTANGQVGVGTSGYVAPGQAAPWGDAVFQSIPQAPRVFRVLVSPNFTLIPCADRGHSCRCKVG